MRIISTKNIHQERLKILIFGKSGAGKTTLAGTIEEPTLIISAESGLLSLADKECDVIELNTDDEGKLLPREKRIDRLMDIYKFLNNSENKYKWIFIDSLTEIGQNLIEKLNVKYPTPDKKLMMWGEYSQEIRGIIKAFRDLPNYNVVFTCLAVEDRDENGRLEIGVDLAGKISQQVPQYFDEVLYLHIKKLNETEDVHQLLCRPVEVVPLVKDRSGKLSKIEKPNLKLIADKIRG
jgi:phage nucleotide-binding protein